MMSTKVGCSLNVYEAKANNVSAKELNPAVAAGGIIEIRIKLRYQLCVKACGFDLLVEDILTPEFRTPFAMPLAFLIPEYSVKYVSDILQNLNLDAQVRNFSSPKIAKFAVDVAKHRGAALSSFKTVAEVTVNKIDYIFEEEFNRISRMLKQQQQQQLDDINGGAGSLMK